MIIDTHAHLMFEQFDGEVNELVARAKAVGVEKIILIGCGVDSSNDAMKMADHYDCFYAVAGLHPYDAANWNDKLADDWSKHLKGVKNLVGIGETGLDYFKADVDPEVQKRSFRGHLRLAEKLGLPVVVHNREADDDCLEILREFPNVKAVFHCYGSDLDFARKVWAYGYVTSFTGIVTFKNAKALQEVVKEVPMGQFFVETDCPYLAPVPYRGKRNEPAYVVEVVKKIAEIKGLSFDEVADVSTENAKKFFQL